MRVICSVCGKELRVAPGPDEVSHGLCEDCFQIETLITEGDRDSLRAEAARLFRESFGARLPESENRRIRAWRDRLSQATEWVEGGEASDSLRVSCPSCGSHSVVWSGTILGVCPMCESRFLVTQGTVVE